MDASKFKDYILSIIFYRYLSEHAAQWAENMWPGEKGSYEELFSRDPAAFRSWSLDSLGYVLEPRYLFSSLIRRIEAGTFSVSLLKEAVESVTASPRTPEAKAAFDGIFDSLDLNAMELGKNEEQRSRLISRVLLTISEISFGAGDAAMDVLGTAYMILIGLFASDAGKKGGEFFTPVQFSRLCARLACLGLEEIPSACDPAMGSATMLLEVSRAAGEIPVGHFYGQEKNRTTYNLARMNMLVHGISCGKFSFYNDDTIASDQFGSRRFRVQVANPPYSQKWDAPGEYLKDPRFAGPGRLAPRSYEDLAFVLHMIWHMDEEGRAVVLLPHGVLFRGGAEAAIRSYFIRDLNVLDAVIGLPAGCFHSTPIPVCCLIFARGRSCQDSILFMDASRSFVPGKRMNTISDRDLEHIVTACAAREDEDRFCRNVSRKEIEDNDYNLTISRYVDVRETAPPVDLGRVQKDLEEHRALCRRLEQQVDEYLSRLGL